MQNLNKVLKKIILFPAKSDFIFCILIYLLATAPCFNYLRTNSLFDIGESSSVTACAVLIAVLTLSLPFLYRHFRRHRNIGLTYLLFAALLCTFVALPSILVSWENCTRGVLYLSGCLAFSYALLRRWSILPWFCWLFLPIVLHLVSLRYQIKVDAHLLAEILGASPQDAARFLTPVNIILATVCPILIIGICICLHLLLKRCERNHLFGAGIIILLITLTGAQATNCNLWHYKGQTYRTPETILFQLRHSRRIAKSLQERIMSVAKSLPSAASPAPTLPPDNQSQECICILHIGESVRSDHVSLFGYNRQTMPLLEQRQRVIAYPDCTSVATSTVPNVFAILTNAKTDIRNSDIDPSLDATCGGIMEIFHALDFSCYAFVNEGEENETWGALFEQLLHSTYASGADKILTIPDVSDSHSQIAQIADTIHSDSKKHIFCLLNNTGSHMPYTDYDRLNPPFSPASQKAYDQQPGKNPEAARTVINTYDCTIHYLDAYIEKLLNKLQGKPFIYIYVSDHGEYFGEHGEWIRNGDAENFFDCQVCQVPFFIITSPEFEQQNPHYAQALVELEKHRTMSISHEHIFHTLLGIFGIQSPYYDEELDLSSDRVKPYTGPHPSRNGEAADGKKWY